MKYLFLFITALCFATNHTKAETYRISTPEELYKAASKAAPGDEIVITNGSYSNWNINLNTNGSAEKPIVIRAESPEKVIFSGDVRQSIFILNGSFTEISGLLFTGCNVFKAGNSTLVELKGHHNRLTRCSFTANTAKNQFTPLVVVSGQAAYNQIDHCNFSENIDNQDLQVKITAAAVPLHTLIEHNVFQDKKPVSWKVFNGGECVQIGQDPVLLGTQNAYTIVKDNRFIRCKGEAEVISNKSSGNTYSNNYFEDCDGELVMRGGHDCVADKNTFKNCTGGIRINGTHHTISNNVMDGLPVAIRLMYGMAKGKTETGFYIAASDCILSGNKISNCQTGILIGDSKDKNWTGKFDTQKYPSRTMQDVAPFNNTLTNNTITGTKSPVVNQEK